MGALAPAASFIAPPVHLDLHHGELAQPRHQFGVDRLKSPERGQRRSSQTARKRDEVLRGQEGAHLLEDVGPLRLVPGLRDAQALEEGHRLLAHLQDVAEPLVRRGALRPLRCGLTTNGKVAHAE